MQARVLGALMVAFVTTGHRTAAVQAPDVPPLTREERFVQQGGLKITLILPDTSLEVGADPRLTLRFENTGANRLYLNPRVESNLRITRADGLPAPLAHTSIQARKLVPHIKTSDLIRLEAQGHWETPVAPIFPGGQYAQHGSTTWGLLLPPGQYVARFIYQNAPGIGATYDVYEMPAGIWEGRMDTPPVRFEVTAASAEQLNGHLRRLRNPNPPETANLLRLLSLRPGALVAGFTTNPADPDVVRAIAMQPPLLGDVPLEAVYRMGPGGVEAFMHSIGLQRLMQERADCRMLTFLSGALASHRGDVVHSFRPAFDKAAAHCPEVRVRLRGMLNDGSLDPSARGNAAAMLGTFRLEDDVPLLTAALDRKLVATAGPSLRHGDPIARGAAAGLAMIGGAAARQALSRALADEQRNFIIGPDLVNRLAALGGKEAIEPLTRALSSTNANIVVAAIAALDQVRDPAVAPHVAKLLTHRNPSIRSHAAITLWASGLPGVAAPMRAAAGDRDEKVRAYVLLYLAKHGQPSDLALFLTHMDSRDQYIGEGARAGVARFGTEASFPRLRKLLDIPHAAVHSNVHETLRQLAFLDYGPAKLPKEWDDWYARRRGTTRADWAREAVEARLRSTRSTASPASVRALEYLADNGDRTLQTLLPRAAASRHFDLRIAAAGVLARMDRARAAQLLLREFDARYPIACASANTALNALAGTDRQVDCADPADRQRAKEEWARARLTALR